MTIRPATLDERPALEALQWRASLAVAAYRDALLAHPDAIELPNEQIVEGRTIVAEVEGKVVGFAVVLPRPDGDAELDGLFVEPSIWRAGIGTRLIREAGILASAAGARFLHVIANPTATGFYSSCGFIVAGEASTRFGMAPTMRKELRQEENKGERR
jgi:GNAT superfamily N-acetyltransferase